MKKLVLFFILLSLALTSLFALTAHDIYFADIETLRSMAALRGLDTNQSESGLRSSLYEYENLESYSEVEEGEGSYSVSIDNANYLSTNGNIITLRGSVSLSFTSGSNEAILTSDEVVIDTQSSLITAIGNVSFDSSGDANSQRISADIVTYYWNKGNIVVENASTLNERKNSEDESINVYSVGERLTYFESGAAIYEDGYIATSDRDPLSSISASNITMLPGSDMLIENAVLNIGRVPLFYFPVFFFPGSRITGNPSFGFTSTKGAFLNTTFEIFGSSNLIESGNSSILSVFTGNSNEEGQYPRGSYYSSSDELSPVQSWANESSSHLAIMADAYSNVGLHAGINSSINLFNKTLNFDTFTGIALTIEDRYNKGHLRFYSQNSLSYSFSGLAISISAPFYSDPNVLMDTGNRITSFSIEPLLFQAPTFPTTYSSSISSFSRTAEIRYNLPSNLRSDWLSSFSISRLRIDSRHSWSSANNEFQIDYINLPELTASLSGSIFNFEYEDKAPEPEELDSADLFLLSDPLLYEVFHEDLIREGHAGSSYSIGMGYQINQSLQNNLDYYQGEFQKEAFSSDTSLRLTTELDLGSYFNLRSVITPAYSYDKEAEEGDEEWRDDFNLTNSIVAEIPFLGIRYTLTNSAYQIERRFDGNDESKSEYLWAFDSDHVSAHSIAFTKTFDTIAGSFTPSLNYTIYPLKGSITPQLSYRIGNFATSFSYRFLEDENNKNTFKSDLISLSLAYNGKNVVTSTSLSYQSADYNNEDFFSPLEINSQFALRTEDRRYSITEQVKWSGYDSSSAEHNYFSSIRTILTLPYCSAYVDFSGPLSNVELSTINLSVNARDILIRAWRNRLYLSLGLSSTLNLDIQNIAASSFTITPSIIFSIAEFLDFRLSFTSGNNNFGSYQEGGSFSFSELWQDLLRSFDFFGSGRYNTNFNMSSISLEVVHYMNDWSLHCNYSTSVVLSGNIYRFVPELSIYLSWNLFPDFAIDRKWEESSSGWRRSS